MEQKITRRQFIKAGALLLPAVGILRPSFSDARWWAQGNGSTSVGWNAWTEDAQSTLASQDILPYFHDATGLGEDDVGQGGGLSGANLILTESGNVPGSSTSPPYRQLTQASSQFFTPTAAALNAMLLGQAEFTIIVKMADQSTHTNFPYDLRTDAGNHNRVAVNITATRTLTCNAGAEAKTTVGTVPDSGTVYIASWRKGGVTKHGFSATRPTSEASFEANNMVTMDEASVITGTTFASIFDFYHVSTYYLTAKAYYIVIAKTCLF